MITLHPSVVLRLLDRLGKGHDQPVFEWQEELIGRVHQMIDNQVCPLLYVICCPEQDSN